MYKILLFFLFSFTTTSSNAAIFEQGGACAGSRHLVNLANEFDAGFLQQGNHRVANPEPVYKQLKNVDRNRRATTGDVEAVFKTILTLRYHRQPLNLPTTHDPLLNVQFNAYRVMDMTCEILMETPGTIHQLRLQTIRKAREQLGVGIFTDAYISALIPDVAITMVQYPVFKEEPSDYLDFKRHLGQNGILLGRYDREETFQSLQKKKDEGKAIYLALGRGNRQPALEGQKTVDGKDIIWAYLDRFARCHSVNREGYFLWEDFNDNLGSKLPENFFDAVIFDWSTTKFIHDKLLTIIQIAKIFTEEGFLIFPADTTGGMPPFVYKDRTYKYDFPFPYGAGNGKNKTMLWPQLMTAPCMPTPREEDTLQRRSAEDHNVIRAALQKTFVDCLQKLFSFLFEDVALITEDDDLGFQLARYSFSPEDPAFKLVKLKKAEIQANPWYQCLYDIKKETYDIKEGA